MFSQKAVMVSAATMTITTRKAKGENEKKDDVETDNKEDQDEDSIETRRKMRGRGPNQGRISDIWISIFTALLANDFNYISMAKKPCFLSMCSNNILIFMLGPLDSFIPVLLSQLRNNHSESLISLANPIFLLSNSSHHH